MDRKIENLVLAVIFVVSVLVIFWGQRNIGYVGLAVEFAGLIGLVLVLFMYNRRYK